MALKNIKVNGNFTVFQDFEIEFGKGINILIGANGVGKTQLLKMLYIHGCINKKTLLSNISSVFGIDNKYRQENLSNAKFHLDNDGVNTPPAVFIPAKEMLSHAKGLPSMKKKYGENMPFDSTLLDIIEKAQAWKLEETPEIARSIIPSLEKVMRGKVEVKDDGSFWMRKDNGNLIPFSLEAEGLKKFGLLWQLLVNESITKNSVVLWDEPEASINPEVIPILVEVILEMQRQGVQIITATHSYNFARYFDALKKNDNTVCYYCLYKSEDGFTQYSKADKFENLIPNPIDDAGEKLFNSIIQKSIEEI